jgi:hypothetical protein
MKKIIMVLGALLATTTSFANVPSSSLNKGSVGLKALSSAWKTDANAATPQSHKDAIEMVYGGQDVSGKPTLALNTSAA